jgi:hypothetical protein
MPTEIEWLRSIFADLSDEAKVVSDVRKLLQRGRRTRQDVNVLLPRKYGLFAMKKLNCKQWPVDAKSPKVVSPEQSRRPRRTVGCPFAVLECYLR